MSLCLVIRSEEEARRLKELALKIAGGLSETLEIWVATEVKVSGAWVDDLVGVGVERVLQINGLARYEQLKEEVSSAWSERRDFEFSA
jgi:hypothetical protein